MPAVKMAPGWYPDPNGSPRRRFWDGDRWTVHYEPPPKWRDRALAHLEQPPARKPHPSPRRWVVAVGSVTAVFVVGFGACAFAVSRLDFKFGPDQLDPIPVPSASCPYLKRVHDTAAVAGEASGAAAQNNDPGRWKAEAPSIAVKLTAFTDALHAADAHTPAPIATRLRIVRVQVAVGLAQLRRARTGDDWTAGTFNAVASGYSSLSQAGELTGDACGFSLAPDPGLYLDHVTTAGSR